MKELIRAQFEESIEIKRRSLALADAVAESAEMLIAALRRGNKILVCGNGGSAADSQHLAAELVGRFEKERQGLPCVALTTDSSVLTAWSNDYSYDTIFARQVSALGSSGDVLIGISTSGNSPNISRAMEEAQRKGMQRVALTGCGGGRLKDLSDVCKVIVPANHTARIQEVHITIIHIWCRLIDEAYR